ncbi:MAG: DNA adenine methylase [Endomicrobium sp.]|nr:DNA adenine methylase [Endomicrobium sp.]
MQLVKDIDTDILYLDPPYNERQYATKLSYFGNHSKIR